MTELKPIYGEGKRYQLLMGDYHPATGEKVKLVDTQDAAILYHGLDGRGDSKALIPICDRLNAMEEENQELQYIVKSWQIHQSKK